MATYGHSLVPRRKVSTTVYITPEQDAVLKALAQRTKVPVAEYIRQGIDLVVEKYRDHLPGQVDLHLGSR
jgi:predicted DNA-binding protein